MPRLQLRDRQHAAPQWRCQPLYVNFLAHAEAETRTYSTLEPQGASMTTAAGSSTAHHEPKPVRPGHIRLQSRAHHLQSLHEHFHRPRVSKILYRVSISLTRAEYRYNCRRDNNSGMCSNDVISVCVSHFQYITAVRFELIMRSAVMTEIRTLEDLRVRE